MMFESVADIPIPEDLSEVDKAEFFAYKQALVELEQEWRQLESGENADYKECLSIIEEVKEKRVAQSAERLNLKREILDKQLIKEKEKLYQERDEYTKLLFDRLVRSYYVAYQSVTSQLKELMGSDYSQYIATKSIDFPTIPSESQMRTRTQQPEELKIRISPAEADNDIHQIQQIIQEASL